MANPLEAIGGLLFGGNKVDPTSTLTEGQRGLLSSLISGGQQASGDLFNTLGALSGSPVSAYDALPDFDQTFRQQFGDPLRQQFEGDLSQIKHSPELFSGGTQAANFRAMNRLNTNLASARANMMMQERERQRQSVESSLGRQLQASQLLSNLSTSPLGVKAQENLVSKTPGLLSIISGIGSAAGSVMGGLSGLGSLGGGSEFLSSAQQGQLESR